MKKKKQQWKNTGKLSQIPIRLHHLVILMKSSVPATPGPKSSMHLTWPGTSARPTRSGSMGICRYEKKIKDKRKKTKVTWGKGMGLRAQGRKFLLLDQENLSRESGSTPIRWNPTLYRNTFFSGLGGGGWNQGHSLKKGSDLFSKDQNLF